MINIVRITQATIVKAKTIADKGALSDTALFKWNKMVIPMMATPLMGT